MLLEVRDNSFKSSTHTSLKLTITEMKWVAERRDIRNSILVTPALRNFGDVYLCFKPKTYGPLQSWLGHQGQRPISQAAQGWPRPGSY